MNNKMKLYETKPSKIWQETYPIGNGSLGAMIWGTVEEELLGLNEETIWSGYDRDLNNPQAYEALETVRELIFAGKYVQAEQLIQDTMLGEFMESYLPLGNLKLQMHPQGTDGVTDYRRMLDIEKSIAGVSYDLEGVHYEREYFASFPHSAILVRLSASASILSVAVSFESELMHTTTKDASSLLISGQCCEHVDPNYIHDSVNPIIQGTKGQHFSGKIEVLSCDGTISFEKDANGNEKLLLTNASNIVLSVSAVKPAVFTDQRYEKIREQHISDYTNIYAKTELFLGEQPELATSERLERLKKGESDNGLYALYFQYGRYLMISSSRKGTLPPNLQGIWSWEMRAPWSSNWTTNINLQMNYWPVQSCNLADCFAPFSDFMKDICENGKKTAATNYHCRGTVLHHNTDYWKKTSPVGIAYGEDKGRDLSVSYAMWPMGGAWLTSELFKHYEYNPDRTYLEDTVYPILRETASFLLDWLVEKDGVYVTCPSTSPENQFYTPEGEVASVGISSAMDLTIIREVFENYRKTCEIVNPQDPILEEIKRIEVSLAPIRIGSFGQILEYSEEYKEVEPGHRHLSHLYGIFPSELFASDPGLTEACRIAMRHRLDNGGGHAGWSCAWIINLFAVLGDGENAFQYLKHLLVNSTYDNLWDAHPPFQIDGNFGGIAGIANMLVQDRNGEVKLLPALPSQFQNGYVKGLRLKDNKTIDISWKNGKLMDYLIY